MEFNIENITDEDIKKVMNYNATYEELMKAHDLVTGKLDKFKCNEPIWRNMCMVLYAYKLGEMQGKRTERARRKNKINLSLIKNFKINGKNVADSKVGGAN